MTKLLVAFRNFENAPKNLHSKQSYIVLFRYFAHKLKYCHLQHQAYPTVKWKEAGARQAQIPAPNSPSWAPIARTFFRRNSERRCNDKHWLIPLHHRVRLILVLNVHADFSLPTAARHTVTRHDNFNIELHTTPPSLSSWLLPHH